VFPKLTGEALSPNMDFREWKDILAAAGIREGRLHNAATPPQRFCSCSESPNGQ
jgi:hypothetical protein